MQHAFKKKMLAALLALSIVVTYMPVYLWMAVEDVYAYETNAYSTDVSVGGTVTLKYSEVGFVNSGNPATIYRDTEGGFAQITSVNDYKITITGLNKGTAYAELYQGDVAVNLTINVIPASSHKVVFNANGGTLTDLSEEYVQYGSTVTEPTAPTREGYTFVGWYTDDRAECVVTGAGFEGGITVTNDNGEYSYSGNATVVASGSNITIYNYNGEELAATPGTITKNYRYDFTQQVTEGVTLYAHWIKDSYTVNFDLQGVECDNAPEPQTVGYLDKAVTPETPVATGKTFAGWYREAECTSPYSFDSQVANNLTLYASWTDLEYDVSFVKNITDTTEAYSTVKVKAGETLTATQLPTNTDLVNNGYTFAGWYTEAEGGNQFDVYSTSINKATTLYAHWTKNTHVVSFNMNGHGTQIGAMTVGDGVLLSATAETTVSAPEEAGWKFIGWSKATDTNVTVDPNTTPITEDTTFYAVWEKAKYTAHLYLDEDTLTTATDIVAEYGSAFAKPTNPTRDGYKFVCWCSDSELKNEYDWATKATGDIELYAKWEAEEYTVSFYMNGHGDQVAEQKKAYDEKVDKPADPSEDGYTFIGWFKAPATGTDLSEEWNFDDDTITENIELVAKWAVAPYTITLDANGGTLASGTNTITAAKGESFTQPADPELENYDFAGWYTDSELNNKYDWSTPATKSLTLYAKWTKKPVVTIYVDEENDMTYWTRFYVSSGERLYDEQIQYNGNMIYLPSDTTTIDDMYTALENARTGYTFLGFFTKEGDEFKSFDWGTAITEDTTLYGRWKKNTYAVTFDMGGHGEQIDGQPVAYGEYATKPDTPTADYWTFVGWYCGPQLDKEDDIEIPEDYSPELANTVFDFKTTPITEDTVVYARWKENSQSEDGCYKVIFNANGGTVTDPEDASNTNLAGITCFVNKNEGNDYVEGAPTTAEREGYDFEGWFTKAGEEFYELFKPTGDTVFYAKWKIKEFEVTFDVGTDYYDTAENVPEDATVEYGGKLTKPANPSCVGYTFEGWYKNNDLTEKYNFQTDTITEKTVLYAKWSPKMCTLKFYDKTSGDGKLVATIKVQQGTVMDDLYADATGTNLNAQLDANGYTIAQSGEINTKTGYKFETGIGNYGWYIDGDTNNEWEWDSVPVLGDMNLYGTWTPITYQLMYLRGNEKATAPSDYVNTVDSNNGAHFQNLTYDTNVNLDKNQYTYKGHKFVGWALVYNYDKSEYDGCKYTGDVIARFDDEATVNTTINGTNTNIIREVLKEAYLNGQLDKYTMVAEWESIQYEVTYNKNGSDVIDAENLDGYVQVLTYKDKFDRIEREADTYTTMENTFEKEGYHFVGWNTQADGSGTWVKGEQITDNHGTDDEPIDHPCDFIYNGVQELGVAYDSEGNCIKDTNLCGDVNGSVTLYAQWAPCENYRYTITEWTEATYAEYTAATYKKVLNENSADYAPTYFVGNVKSYVGKTDDVITATTSLDVDYTSSTKNLSMVLTADKYEDACTANEDVRAAANIDIFEKYTAKVNYKSGTGSAYAPEVQSTINSTANQLVYNAKEQELVTAGFTEDGTIYYCVNPNINDNSKYWTWSTAIPTAKEEGSYDVWYYIKGNGVTTQDTTAMKVGTAVIQPKEVEIYWGKTTFNFDGLNHLPTATAKGVCDGDECTVTVTYEQGNASNLYTGEKKIGTGYTATVYADALSNHNYCVKKVSTEFSIVEAPLLAKATPVGAKKMKIYWTRVKGATRYEIYAVNCGKSTVYKKYATTGAGALSKIVTKAGGKNMKANKSYKFYVIAYDDNGQVARSNACHAITKKTKGKYANPTSITTTTTSIEVDETCVAGIGKAKVKLPKNKIVLGTNHVAPLRYVSGDPGIATVDAYGTVRGVHAGKCYVYTQTVNGMWTATLVTVK